MHSNIFKFFGAVIICELAGLLGSLFTVPNIPTWYAGLVKPSFTPPAWVFAPVWTLLFFLMGLAAFLIWRQGLQNRAVKSALGLFLVQLLLNVFWSVVFFSWHSLAGASLEIVILWLAIFLTVLKFYKLSKAASWLLLPYLVWASFAAVLTFSLWRLN